MNEQMEDQEPYTSAKHGGTCLRTQDSCGNKLKNILGRYVQNTLQNWNPQKGKYLLVVMLHMSFLK